MKNLFVKLFMCIMVIMVITVLSLNVIAAPVRTDIIETTVFNEQFSTNATWTTSSNAWESVTYGSLPSTSARRATVADNVYAADGNLVIDAKTGSHRTTSNPTGFYIGTTQTGEVFVYFSLKFQNLDTTCLASNIFSIYSNTGYNDASIISLNSGKLRIYYGATYAEYPVSDNTSYDFKYMLNYTTKKYDLLINNSTIVSQGTIINTNHTGFDRLRFLVNGVFAKDMKIIIDNLKVTKPTYIQSDTTRVQMKSSTPIFNEPFNTNATWTTTNNAWEYPSAYGSLPPLITRAQLSGDSVLANNGKAVINLIAGTRGNNPTGFQTNDSTLRSGVVILEYDILFNNLDTTNTIGLFNMYSTQNFTTSSSLSLYAGKLKPYSASTYQLSITQGQIYSMRFEVNYTTKTYNWYANNTVIGENIPFSSSTSTNFNRIQFLCSGTTNTNMQIKIDNFKLSTPANNIVSEYFLGSEWQLSQTLDQYTPPSAYNYNLKSKMDVIDLSGTKVLRMQNDIPSSDINRTEINKASTSYPDAFIIEYSSSYSYGTDDIKSIRISGKTVSGSDSYFYGPTQSATNMSIPNQYNYDDNNNQITLSMPQPTFTTQNIGDMSDWYTTKLVFYKNQNGKYSYDIFTKKNSSETSWSYIGTVKPLADSLSTITEASMNVAAVVGGSTTPKMHLKYWKIYEVTRRNVMDIDLVDDITLTDSGNTFTNLYGKTSAFANVTVRKNFPNDANCMIAVAYYDTNNTLKLINYQNKTISGTKDLSITINDVGINSITPSNGWYVKVFVWDSITSMIPISNKIGYVVATQ